MSERNTIVGILSSEGVGVEVGVGEEGLRGKTILIPTSDWSSYVAKSFIKIGNNVGEIQSPCFTSKGQ